MFTGATRLDLSQRSPVARAGQPLPLFPLPTQAALFASQLLFDVVILYEAQTAPSALLQRDVPVFIDGPLGQRDALYVALGDQSAQDS